MKYIASIAVIVCLLVLSLTAIASAQNVKTFKFGPSTSQVSAPKFHPTPGPTAY